jgi:4'-phosphopantetheinyl transferase EntD
MPVIAAENPAKLSPILANLFPAGFIVAELRESGDPSLLHPEEAAGLKRAVESRRQEFAAGRLCARRVLSEFGISDFPITAADDRTACWPKTLVGSITHTAGFCAAVAAEHSKFAAVGIDSELAGSVKPELWPSICTPPEIAWLKTLAESQQPMAATLIFSAKEAFYKCQYPCVGERLNFQDAEIELLAWGSERGAFGIHPTRRIELQKVSVLPLMGSYLFHEQFLSTGIAVSAQ